MTTPVNPINPGKCLPLLALSILLLSPAHAANPRPVLMTGEVVAADSQLINVPPSNSSPTTLRNFVADGEHVKIGDLVLRIDAQSDTKLDQLEVEIAQTRDKTMRDAADLEVKAIESETLLVNAQAALAKAKVDAALPQAQIARLDYDRYQGELDRATRDLEVKQKGLSTANDNVGRRVNDGELALKKLQINFAFAKVELGQAEVRAQQDGYVVHNYGGRRGERFEEGSNARPGNIVGQVLGNGQVKVIVWALEADRTFLTKGQKLRVSFDSLPGASVTGAVTLIASAPEERSSWGDGRYFRVELALPLSHGLALVHGMSALIEPLPEKSEAQNAQNTPSSNLATPPNLKLEGEIQSKQNSFISPPKIKNVWQYNLVFLESEGKLVKAGQAVATFEANDAIEQLESSRSTVKEKQRALEKLKLDHAEAAKSADLAVNEAMSNAEKAQRKASLPREVVRRVDYDKLVIERAMFDKLAGLAVRQRDAKIRARRAELSGLLSEIKQLNNTINALAKGQKDLTVLAPRGGMVLHKTDYSGNKYAVGTKVFIGTSVANLADPEKLFVLAKVPEAQASLVKIGQRARVTIPGANLELNAIVGGLGRIYHGKSSSQPVIVRDVWLEFDAQSKELKPGAAVQVNLSLAQQSGATEKTAQAGGKEK
jgi:multidrug resistance efflux pump